MLRVDESEFARAKETTDYVENLVYKVACDIANEENLVDGRADNHYDFAKYEEEDSRFFVYFTSKTEHTSEYREVSAMGALLWFVIPYSELIDRSAEYEYNGYEWIKEA